MSKDYMAQVLAWSQKMCPELNEALGWLCCVLSGEPSSLVHVHVKKLAFVTQHLKQITFSAMAWTLWTREVLQSSGNECGPLNCLYYRCFKLVKLHQRNITIFDEATVDRVLAKYLAGDKLLLSDQQALFEIYLMNQEEG